MWKALLFKEICECVLYAGLALPLGLASALGIALLLNSKISGQSLYRTIIFLPSLVPIRYELGPATPIPG